MGWGGGGGRQAKWRVVIGTERVELWPPCDHSRSDPQIEDETPWMTAENGRSDKRVSADQTRVSMRVPTRKSVHTSTGSVCVSLWSKYFRFTGAGAGTTWDLSACIQEPTHDGRTHTSSVLCPQTPHPQAPTDLDGEGGLLEPVLEIAQHLPVPAQLLRQSSVESLQGSLPCLSMQGGVGGASRYRLGRGSLS